MKNYLLFILLICATSANCIIKSRASVQPQSLDTVKIYNVYCSCTEGNSITAWGGNYSSFYPAEECPQRDKEKYLANYKEIESYLSAQKFFWMKLYNMEDKLIFESLKFSGCRVGKFVCYWPNGQRMLTGQFDGVTIQKKTGEYIFKKCAGEKTGTWCHYDKNGKFLSYDEY